VAPVALSSLQARFTYWLSAPHHEAQHEPRASLVAKIASNSATDADYFLL